MFHLHRLLPPMKNALSTLLVVALSIACTVVSTAQNFRFGIKAGAGLANLDYAPLAASDMAPFDYYNGLWYDREKSSFGPAFLLGETIEYDLSKDVFLASGIQLTSRYAHVNVDEPTSNTNDFRLNLLHLQLPLKLHYRAGKLFLGAGGYASLGAGGKWKNTNTLISPNGTVTTETSGPVKFGKKLNESNMKRFDAGVGLELGYGFKTIRLNLSYEGGFVNNLSSGIGPKEEKVNSRLYHQVIYLTATYYWIKK